jgi:streptogramin lyase
METGGMTMRAHSNPSWRRRPLGLGMTLAAALALAVAGLTPAQAAFSIIEYPVPTAGGFPLGTALGSDGNVWFTEFNADKIAKITPAGVVTEYPIPTASSQPQGIAAGPDGNLWFTETAANKIGKITPAGVITEYPVPTANSGPIGITAGPDGRLWFTEYDANQIGRVSTSGVIKTFKIPVKASGPLGITAGPDNNLWFTQSNSNQIGRITTSGTVTEFGAAAAEPYAIAPGSDHDLWYTQYGSLNNILKMTTAGKVAGSFLLPATGTKPLSIAPGPDGNLWFTEWNKNKIGQITTGGTITEFKVPTAASKPWGITPGADGNMWFAETAGNKIGTIGLPHLNLINIYYIPNRFFIPNETSLVNQGETVNWLDLNPGRHGIADASGMGLFGARNGVAIGGTFSFTFTAAGSYSYDDPFAPADQGQVSVPISVQPVVGAVGTAQVTWSSAGPPAGFAVNVQVQQPGSATFVPWQTGVTSLSATFGPNDPLWAGPGTYQFRAQLENTTNGATSGFSTPGSIPLS